MDQATQQALRGNIWKSYLLRVLVGCFSFSIPTIVLLWQQNGVDLHDGMLLQAIFAVTLAIFDVPTGYIADICGRKRAIIAASLATFGGALIYCVADDFNGFLAAEVLVAIGFSLSSGADQALLYDSLLELKQDDEYERIWGKGTALWLVGMSVCTIIGGFAASVSLRLPCYIQAGFAAPLILVSFLLHEPSMARHEHDDIRRWQQALTLLMRGGPRIKWLLLYPAVLFAFMQAPFWLYQPYFVSSGVPLDTFGLIFALFNITAALGARNVHRLSPVVNEKITCLGLAILLGGSYLLLGSFVGLFSFLFILPLQLVRGCQQVLFSDLLNREVPSAVRASVLSVQSMGGRLAYSLMLLPAAALVRRMEPAGVFSVAGAATVCAACLLLATSFEGPRVPASLTSGENSRIVS